MKCRTLEQFEIRHPNLERILELILPKWNTCLTDGPTKVWRRGTCSRSPDTLVAEGGPRPLSAEIWPLHQAEFCQVTHSAELQSSESETTTRNGRTGRILSSYLVVQVSRGLGQGYATIDGRARTEIHFSWLQIQSYSCVTLCNIRKQHYLQDWLRLGNSSVIFSLMSIRVEGAAFYFTCVLETSWWGSVCLTIGGVFIVTMLSSYKENFYSEPESCLAYCYGCRQEGTWCVTSEQTLVAL